jgi:Zn-dependent protease
MLHYLQGLLSALDLTSLLDAVLRVAAIFLCLTVHETCHGLAALALGDPTAKSMHRLSLNPLRHIDWIGLLMMFVAGFGWAKPVPVDPRYFRKPKQGMALTALAGPVSNFVLAVLAMLISKVIYLYAPYSAAMDVVFSFCLYTLAPLSIGLGLFNLIPIPPLDGSKVLAAFLSDRQYITLMRYERYGIVVLLVLSFVGIGSSLISRGILGIYSALLSLIFG